MTDGLATSGKTRDTRQFASFIVTGGIAAGVNVVSRWMISHVLRYEIAVILAYLVGMTTAYLLAKRFVFTSGGLSGWQEFRRFSVVNMVSALMVLGVSVGLARIVFPVLRVDWHAEDLAHLIGVASPIVLSYFAHKHYSFGGGTSAT